MPLLEHAIPEGALFAFEEIRHIRKLADSKAM